MTKAERHKIYMREVWYPRNRAKHIALVRKNKDKHRKETLEVIRSIKVKCSRCDESDPVALDFHHRTPESKFLTVSQMVSRGYGLEALMIEIEKCDVLCSNCHRKEHFYRSVEF